MDGLPAIGLFVSYGRSGPFWVRCLSRVCPLWNVLLAVMFLVPSLDGGDCVAEFGAVLVTNIESFSFSFCWSYILVWFMFYFAFYMVLVCLFYFCLVEVRNKEKTASGERKMKCQERVNWSERKLHLYTVSLHITREPSNTTRSITKIFQSCSSLFQCLVYIHVHIQAQISNVTCVYLGGLSKSFY